MSIIFNLFLSFYLSTFNACWCASSPLWKIFMNNKIFSIDIFFSWRKTPYPLLSISYTNYVQQYLQTISIEKNCWKKKPRNSDSSIYRENFSVYVDPIIGIIFVISLLWSSYSLAVDSSNILLQTIPGSLVKFYPSRCLFRS